MNTSVLRPIALALCAAGAFAGAQPSRGAGLDLAGIDRSVAPGDDFFAYANGTWLKTTEIPPDRGSYGVGRHRVRPHAPADRRRSDQEAAAGDGARAGSDARKIGDYYASFMDEAAIEAKGLAPLQPTLDAIAAIARPPGARPLPRRHAARRRRRAQHHELLHRQPVRPLGRGQDLDQPTRYVPFLMQGGLDMPDRAYYVDASPRDGRDPREVPGAHRRGARPSPGSRTPKRGGARVRAGEAGSPRPTRAARTRRTSKKANNHWSRADFARERAGRRLGRVLRGRGPRRASAEFVVWQPERRRPGLAALVASEPLETWKDYLAFHAHRALRERPARRVRAGALRVPRQGALGTPKRRERWKRAVDATNAALGEAVGKLYVERYFPPAEKARVEEMVKNLHRRVRPPHRRARLDDAGDQGQGEGQARVLKVGVGYPDTLARLLGASRS